MQEQRPSLKAGIYHSLGLILSQLEQWHYSTLHNFTQCQRRGPGPTSVLPEITSKGFLHSKLTGLDGMLIQGLNTRWQQLPAISVRPTITPRFHGFCKGFQLTFVQEPGFQLTFMQKPTPSPAKSRRQEKWLQTNCRPKFVTGACFQTK